jgi:SNF family Na+-dependent transporter
LVNIAMLLLFFAIILAIRIFALETPDPDSHRKLGYEWVSILWNPDFSALGNPNIWLTAAGKIFFILSSGMGTIHAYASYLKPNDDIVYQD